MSFPNTTLQLDACLLGEATAHRTPQDMALAFACMALMALLPILVGARRSVVSHREQATKPPEAITKTAAALCPLSFSCVLFALYLLSKWNGKSEEEKETNLLLSYFLPVPLVLSQACAIFKIVSWLIHKSFVPCLSFHQTGKEKSNWMPDKLTTHDALAFTVASSLYLWYFWKKHWVANNILSLAMATEAIGQLHLDSVVTGFILLGGMFFYDIFWVFSTDVMVTVVKSLEVPNKIVFPWDLLENGFGANKLTVLGLGDVLIPGIFVAVILRYDRSLKRSHDVYFWVTVVAYIVGLLITFGIVHVFKHAQPALLYLVPLCLIAPTFIAFCRGDIKSMFEYEDYPTLEKKQKLK